MRGFLAGKPDRIAYRGDLLASTAFLPNLEAMLPSFRQMEDRYNWAFMGLRRRKSLTSHTSGAKRWF